MDGRQDVAVLLFGAPGAGVSALVAALLSAAGAGPAVSAGPSRLAAGAYDRAGARVWLLDPPGDPDLAGERQAALRVATAAVLVVSPVQGVDPRSVALWERLEHLPRLVVLTQLDRPGADADEAVAVCRRVLGEDVVPLQLPLHDDDGAVGGLLDLLHLQVSEGGGRRPAEPEHVILVEGLRGELVEAVLTGSQDEELFEAFLDDALPAPTVLDAELAAALGRGDLQPVLVTAPRRGVGLDELLGLLAALPAEATPPAAQRPDGTPVSLGRPDGPAVVEVVTPGLARVWSGAVEPATDLLLDGRTVTWPGPAACAGDLVGQLPADLLPRDVLADVALTLAPWPSGPAFAVGAPDDADLGRRVLADPGALLRADPRTGQLLLWTHGPAHAELLLAGLPARPVQVPAGSRRVAVRAHVPAWAERAVRSDVAGRGGSVEHARPDDHGVVLDLRLPPAEVAGYALALARATAHTGVLEHP